MEVPKTLKELTSIHHMDEGVSESGYPYYIDFDFDASEYIVSVVKDNIIKTEGFYSGFPPRLGIPDFMDIQFIDKVICKLIKEFENE